MLDVTWSNVDKLGHNELTLEVLLTWSAGNRLTEAYDVTIQIYRKSLTKIKIS